MSQTEVISSQGTLESDATHFQLPPERRASDFRRTANVERPWLWHGYLAPAATTLLTSQWKSGKTTLVSVLLARLEHGGQLLGLPVRPAKALVVSEESEEQWDERCRLLGLGDHHYWQCRPFRGQPTHEEWRGLMRRCLDLQAGAGVELIVIDPIASFFPGKSECNAATMMEALAPLQELIRRNLSVLLLHHPRKAESVAGRAARGSGALPGFVDIVLEMDFYRHDDADDRRRRLRGFSRCQATPRQLVLELTEDGTDYLTHGGLEDAEFTGNWQRLQCVLEDAHQKLTRRGILGDWPADFERVHEATLARWLDRAVGLGLVLREGTGRKNAPYRFWLPGQEEKWQQDPFYFPEPPPMGELYPFDADLMKQVTGGLFPIKSRGQKQ